jgi:hypothetical protein
MFRAAVLLTISCVGCNLEVKPFAGSVLAMTLAGATPSPSGRHLELWVRDGYDDIVRLDALATVEGAGASSAAQRLTPFGIVIRPALTMNDPCMIDDAGNLLVTAAAYPTSVVVGGVMQSPEEQAQTERWMASALSSTSSCDGSGLDPRYHCGRQPANLLGIFPYELVDLASGQVLATAPTPPVMPFDTPPADRLAACRDYWQNPLAYTPNARQLTAPAHGAMFGVVTFTSAAPTVAYDQIRIDSPTHFGEVRELFLTDEGDSVDPHARGPVYLGGRAGAGGRAAYHMDLVAPDGANVAGSATFFTDFDQAPSGL